MYENENDNGPIYELMNIYSSKKRAEEVMENNFFNDYYLKCDYYRSHYSWKEFREGNYKHRYTVQEEVVIDDK